MAYTRRRPVDSFEGATPSLGVRQEVLSSLNGGYQGYSDPVLLSPQFWAAASNVYSGQHGQIRRARFAHLLDQTLSAWGTTPASSLYVFGDPTPQQLLLVDTGTGTGAKMYSFSLVGTGAPVLTQRNAATINLGNDAGPWSRASLTNLLFEMNGMRKQKGRGANLATVEDWGLNSPTNPPVPSAVSALTNTIVAATGAVRAANVVTLTFTGATSFVTGDYITVTGVTDTSFNSATGTSFGPITVVGVTASYSQIGIDTTSGSGTASESITKTVGRSYQWAEENANTGHVGPPSPASAYFPFSSQIGQVSLTGSTVFSISAGSPTVIYSSGPVNSPAFSQASVGKMVYMTDLASFGFFAIVSSVQSSTAFTLDRNAPGNHNVTVVLLDPQTTHIRFYATADGGSVYFLAYRFLFNGLAGLAGSGTFLRDTANAEPPNAPFSSEQAQRYNIPPPIGTFVDEYQSRIMVMGVPAAPASLFYSNIEATQVGQPPESFAPLNQITFPIGSASLRGGAPLPTGYVVWSNQHDMFKVTGLLSDNASSTDIQQGSTIQRLPYKLGAASFYGRAITPLGIFWLSSDREVWLFTDHYAPKNVGKSVQDLLNRINPARLQFARMSYYKTKDRNWLVLAVALDTSTTNNTLLILDLDLLASNGQPSYFTFDMATNAPSWYVFSVPCESIAVGFDSLGNNHLYGSDVGIIRDLAYRAGDTSLNPTTHVFDFTNAGEDQVVSNNLLLHPLGNEQSGAMKRMEFVRFVTIDIPQNIVTNGWQFSIQSVDDDFYTFSNPFITLLTPGTDSPPGPVPGEYGPSKFVLGGVKYAIGRRFNLGLVFPTAPGDWALREIQVQYRALTVR